MSVQNYSKTAASNTVVNDGADAVSVAEGMARASVNDAIRSMMADIAKYVRDHGALTTSGTGSAYVINTNSPITALTDGLTLAAKAHADSGNNATLNVNALGAHPLKLRGGAGLVTAQAGNIKAGDMLWLTYRDNSWVCAGLATADFVTTVVTASYIKDVVTPAYMLASLLGVDGASSDLDADKVDGLHAASFMRSDTDTDANGLITTRRNSDEQVRTGYDVGDTINPYWSMYRGGTARTAYIQSRADELRLANEISGGTIGIFGSGDVRINGGRVTHTGILAGNIGSYVFAQQRSGATIPINATVAGSDLQPEDNDLGGSASVLSGTWRCCGHVGDNDASVFYRIA